jgi:hypothetical protein
MEVLPKGEVMEAHSEGEVIKAHSGGEVTEARSGGEVMEAHSGAEVGMRNFFSSLQPQFRNLKEALPQSQFRNF